MYFDSNSPKNVFCALRHPGRVVSISSNNWVMGRKLRVALDKPFPVLETFSLLVSLTEDSDPQAFPFPQNSVCPHLRTLYLENVNIFEIPSILTSAATSLVSLRIEEIEGRSYIPPDGLVGRILRMPRLEELSICFLAYYRLPDTEREFWDTQITRTVLPNLSELTFRGDSAYLEKMIALISTPLLQYFDVTFYSQPTLALQHVSEFLSTI